MINTVASANTMKSVRIVLCTVVYYRSESQRGRSLVNITSKIFETIMKKEIIECAAVNYDSRAIAFRAYVAGAEWRISVIWNDASEEPEDNKMILALDNNDFPIIVLAVSGKWEETVSSLKIKIWAYIEDLIPSKEK